VKVKGESVRPPLAYLTRGNLEKYPDAAPDRGRQLVSRDIKVLQAPPAGVRGRTTTPIGASKCVLGRFRVMNPGMFWFFVALCDSLIALVAGVLAGWLSLRFRSQSTRWATAVVGTTVLSVLGALAFGVWFGATFFPQSNIVPVPVVFPCFLLFGGPVVGLLIERVCRRMPCRTTVDTEPAAPTDRPRE